MATEVFLDGSQTRAKVRDPWGVLGLALITLGIYSIFWWYYINREMRDLGRARGVAGLGDSPGLSTLAYTLGGYLIVPVIWTIVTTSQRVSRSQGVVGLADRLNGWIAGLLWVFTLGLGGLVYTQMELNKAWRTLPEAPSALPAAPTAGADLERLEKLQELHESGALSDAEFEAEKARILPTAQRSGAQPE